MFKQLATQLRASCSALSSRLAYRRRILRLLLHFPDLSDLQGCLWLDSDDRYYATSGVICPQGCRHTLAETADLAVLRLGLPLDMVAGPASDDQIRYQYLRAAVLVQYHPDGGPSLTELYGFSKAQSKLAHRLIGADVHPRHVWDMVTRLDEQP